MASVEIPNFDLQFDFGFESDEEYTIATSGKKRRLDVDSESSVVLKRRKIETKFKQEKRKYELSENARKFYSLESGESSSSEEENENPVRPVCLKRKVRRVNKMELRSKARLFHNFLGLVRDNHLI